MPYDQFVVLFVCLVTYDQKMSDRMSPIRLRMFDRMGVSINRQSTVIFHRAFSLECEILFSPRLIISSYPETLCAHCVKPLHVCFVFLDLLESPVSVRRV